MVYQKPLALVIRVSRVYFLEQESHVFSKDSHGFQSLGVFLDIPFVESKHHVGAIRPDNEHFKTSKRRVHRHEGSGRSGTLGDGDGGTGFVSQQPRIGDLEAFLVQAFDMLTHESGQLVRSLMSEALLDDEFALFRKIR